MKALALHFKMMMMVIKGCEPGELQYKKAAMKRDSEICKWHNPQQTAIIKPNQSNGAALYGTFNSKHRVKLYFLPLSLSTIDDKWKAITLNL